MKKILLLLLASSFSFCYGQVLITHPNGRTQVISKVNNLVCTLDNIGGAVVTIHINCKVPLGYILITTTTPRITATGGSEGSFTDDEGNVISWLLQQSVKGVVSYQITDNVPSVVSGVF